MNDVMIVTPHSSFRDRLIYDGMASTEYGNISLSDAVNIYCMKKDMICPVCGEVNCVYFKRLCDDLLKKPNDKELKKIMVKSQTIGVPFTKVFDEYRNKVENQLAGALKRNGIVPTLKIRREMFSKYMNLFDMLNRKVVNGKEIYIDKHIKSSIFSKINSKTSAVLTYLNTLDATRNIKNYPEMIDALRKNDFNRASKSFYKMMPKDLESYLALDTIIDEAIAKRQVDEELKKI